MNKKDTEYFKNKLEKERTLLEGELGSIGRVNPEHPDEWNATSGEIETDSADDNEVADKFEELEENKVILNQLEPQYKEVLAAIERIDKGSYGVCEKGGETIEKERLDANPSSRTCMKHM